MPTVSKKKLLSVVGALLCLGALGYLAASYKNSGVSISSTSTGDEQDTIREDIESVTPPATITPEPKGVGASSSLSAKTSISLIPTERTAYILGDSIPIQWSVVGDVSENTFVVLTLFRDSNTTQPVGILAEEQGLPGIHTYVWISSRVYEETGVVPIVGDQSYTVRAELIERSGDGGPKIIDWDISNAFDLSYGGDPLN